MDGVSVIWKPQPGPQVAFVTSPVYEVLYGGSRGGGKTEALLGEWLVHSHQYRGAARGLLVRRSLPQLEEIIARSKELYPRLGGVYKSVSKTWYMSGGGVLRLRYLDCEEDAMLYQGHQYSRVYVDEATSWTTSAAIDRLRATLRSAKGVPVSLRLTANPGGPGHHWVKNRYIDPAPSGWELLQDPSGLERIFIPARLADNPCLVLNDPLYVQRLRQTGSQSLVRAWLEGDWSMVEGGFFDCWEYGRHVLRTVKVNPEWPRLCSLDWGSARPFSVGWWVVVMDDWVHPDGIEVMRGALIRYREWYGKLDQRHTNLGLKLTAEEVARGIRVRQKDENICDAVADPSIFHQDGGPSIAERMSCEGVYFRAADNRRTAGRGALGGWDQMRARLIGYDNKPMIFCFDNCIDSIRTIPLLQHDLHHVEDVDTQSEDHIADEWRYACMSRPIDPTGHPWTQPQFVDAEYEVLGFDQDPFHDPN